MALNQRDREKAIGLVRDFCRSHAAWRQGEKQSENYQSSLAALNGIWSLLKPEFPFEDTIEIRQFLVGRLQELGHDFSPEKDAGILVDELIGPYPSWSFQLIVRAMPIFTSTQTAPIVLGSARDSLRIGTLKDAPHAAVLSGTVTAPTRVGAILATERRLDAFMGATVALDLASLFHGFRAADPSRSRRGFLINDEPAALAGTYEDRMLAYAFHGATARREVKVLRPTAQERDEADKRFNQLARVMCGGSEPTRVVHTACRLAINAEDAFDFGVFLSLAFTCLECILLEDTPADVTARLSEAVAHLLGNSLEEVKDLRKMVKALYGLRSKFAHTGATKEMPTARADMTDLLHRVLAKQIVGLPEVDA